MALTLINSLYVDMAAQPALTALVGTNIFPQKIPQQLTNYLNGSVSKTSYLPCVTVTMLTDTIKRTQTKDKPRHRVCRTRLEFAAWARDTETETGDVTADLIAKCIDDLYGDGFTGFLDGFKIGSAFKENQYVKNDAVTGLYVTILDITFNYVI